MSYHHRVSSPDVLRNWRCRQGCPGGPDADDDRAAAVAHTRATGHDTETRRLTTEYITAVGGPGFCQDAPGSRPEEFATPDTSFGGQEADGEC
jgi:hypothetical protein